MIQDFLECYTDCDIEIMKAIKMYSFGIDLQERNEANLKKEFLKNLEKINSNITKER